MCDVKSKKQEIMKQHSKSLKLNKFTVAKLNDDRKVLGGGSTDNDGTDQDLAHPNCITNSRVRVP